MRELSFYVAGVPAPGGSKKAFVPRGWTRAVITDAGGVRNKEWKAAVASAAYEAMRAQGEKDLFHGPVVLDVTFYMPRPKAHFNSKGALKSPAPIYHTKAPDALKLTRSTEDALKGVVWVDDSGVVYLKAKKIYGQSSGASIKVSRIDQ